MSEQSRDKWAKELLESALSIDWHDSEPQARRVADAAAAKAESAPAPETGSVPNLTRLKARWQTEALHEAMCVLESEFDPTHPIIERLEGLEQEMRCRAEEG